MAASIRARRRMFTVTVTAVNDAPGFTKGADQTVNEDASVQSIGGWATAISAGPADEESQLLDFVVTTDDNALFSVQPTIAPNGTLTYTPAPNAFGTATVTVKLHDDGGTANGGVDISVPQTFTITINAVNDAPSFVKGADQTVLEDAGLQTVTPWATATSAGPANESSQTVAFEITGNTNPALFAAGPSVAPNRGTDVHASGERQRYGDDHPSASMTTAGPRMAGSTSALRNRS